MVFPAQGSGAAAAVTTKRTRISLSGDTTTYDTGVFTKVPLDTTDEDGLSAADLGNDRLQVPATSDGKVWHVYARIQNTGARDPAAFYVAQKASGGATVENFPVPNLEAEVSGVGDSMDACFHAEVSSGDTFELYAYHAHGSTVTFVGEAVLSAVEYS